MPICHMAVKHMSEPPFPAPWLWRTICHMNINEALGKAIATHRRAAGVVQKKIPYDQGAYSKVENGKQSISMEKLAEIASAIHSTPSEIWATAEGFLSAQSSAKKTKMQKAASVVVDRLATAAEIQSAYATAVEDAISTIPTALASLRDILHQRALHSQNAGEREVFAHLADRVESVIAHRRPESSSIRARARAG